MSFLEGFELVSGTGWKAAAQAAPAALAGFQAIKVNKILLKDNLDNQLYSSDNILLISHL